MDAERHVGSFRDPAGFIYARRGVIYRQVNRSFGEAWDRFVGSGALDSLVESGLLLPSSGVSLDLAASDLAHAVIEPQRVPFISYPYEWCFSQLRDAALLTLRAMREAMGKGFWLRDATAYNVQFLGSKPILIDHLSFGEYEEGKPWPAYGQFCRHFLAPLELAARVDPALLGQLRAHIDGIPLDLASRMLPKSTYLKPGILTHIHLHAAAGGSSVKPAGPGVSRPVPKAAILGLVDSLERTIAGIKPRQRKTTWGDYYGNTNYDADAFEAKRRLVEGLAGELGKPEMVWDLGANTGVFSEAIGESGPLVVAWDGDPNAVEAAYLKWRKEGKTNLLPLLQDFANPSPGLGWAGRERDSLAARGPADLTLALALIHHLAIGNNVPLSMVAAWLASLGKACIIEFVPKEDSQVKRMLSTREDIFDDYHEEGFRAAMAGFFDLRKQIPIEGTARTLHLYTGKEPRG